MVGMPYPNIKSPELQEKMTWLDKTMVTDTPLLFLPLIFTTNFPPGTRVPLLPSKTPFSFELFHVSQTVVMGAQPPPYCICTVRPMHRGQWREATPGLPGK